MNTQCDYDDSIQMITLTQIIGSRPAKQDEFGTSKNPNKIIIGQPRISKRNRELLI
jgi:hypothetical protein